jgi:hypothetical protein
MQKSKRTHGYIFYHLLQSIARHNLGQDDIDEDNDEPYDRKYLKSLSWI